MSTTPERALAVEAKVSRFIGVDEYLPILIIDMQGHGVDCAMCGAYTQDRWVVPWYEEPVRSDYTGEHGYMGVCKGCYEKWDTWDSSFSAGSELDR